MNWYSIFYLFSVADGLKTFFVVAIVIFTITSFASTIFYLINSEEKDYKSDEADAKRYQAMSRKWMWWSLPFACLFWILYIMIPDRKDMVMIIAGGAVGEFVLSDPNARQLPADVTRFLRKEILDATADLSDEAKQAMGIKPSAIDSAAQELKKLSKEQLEKMLLEKIKD